MKRDFDNCRRHLVAEQASINFGVTTGVGVCDFVEPRSFERRRTQRNEIVVHLATRDVRELCLVRRGVARDQSHRAASAASVRVKTDVDAIKKITARFAIHLSGHFGWRGPTVALIVARTVIERCGLSLCEIGLNPISHALVFAGICRNATAKIHCAHAVAETNRVRDDRRARGSAAKIADDDRAVGRVCACVEIIFTEINPAVADHVMRDAHEGFTASVTDAIELITAIRASQHPCIDGIKTSDRNRGSVSGRGGFGGGERSEAIRDISRASEEVSGRTVVPCSDVSDRRVVVVENDFIGLMAEWTEGNDCGTRVETVLREEIELIEIAVIFIHLKSHTAL